MLNALLYALVLGFVAVAVFGHVLVFTAILFGRSERSAGTLSRAISRFRRAATAA
jgi:hypothetical protein